ncbi:MAG: type II CAAX prenyl endopeptidase Rce1 family protein, partial [Rubripirellula sp.]
SSTQSSSTQSSSTQAADSAFVGGDSAGGDSAGGDSDNSRFFESDPPRGQLQTTPRWWTALAVAGVSLASFLFASFVTLLFALLLVHGELSLAMLRDPESFAAVSKSRLGLLIVVVIPQLALVTPSVLAAFLSPVPTLRRLGLVRGNWPFWTWFAAAAATPLVGMISGLAVGMFLDESESLKEMSNIFRDHGQNGFLWPIALMIGITPAFCEELLFRGYLQTRLVRSFGPLIGVFTASAMFAIVHFDPVHIVAVFPLGLFLGWVTWRSGSLYPAMLGHFVNNFISVVAVVLVSDAEAGLLSLPAVAFSLIVFASGVVGLASVSVASVLYRSPQSAVR